MEIEIKDRTFDSERASNGDLNQPLIELSQELTDIIGLCVVSASVPFTYYVFTTENNTFRVSGTLVTIEPQTLSSTRVGSILKQAFATAGVSGASNFEAFVDRTTSQLVIYNTASMAFTLDFTTTTSAFRPFGFAPTTYSSVTAGSLGLKDNNEAVIPTGYRAIVSPFAVNFAGPTQLYVHDRIFGPAMNGAVTNDSNTSDIIGDFPVNSNYQGTIVYQAAAPVMYNAQISSLKKVNLYLTLGSGSAPLDLRGVPWQVKIRFFCRKGEYGVYGSDQFGNSHVMAMHGSGQPQMRADIPRKRIFR